MLMIRVSAECRKFVFIKPNGEASLSGHVADHPCCCRDRI